MSNAIRIIFKTVVFYFFVVIGATFIMFTLLWAAPGDLRDVLCPKGCDAELQAELAKQWGLNEPLWKQYGHWLGKAAHFEFGKSVSMRQGAPVAEILKPAIKLTSFLVLGAAFLSLLLSFFLAWRPIRRSARWLLSVFQYPWIFFSFAPLYILAYWMVMATSRFPVWLVHHGYLSMKTLQYWRDIDFIPFGQQVDMDAGWIYFAIHFFVAMLLLALGNNNLVEQASGLRAELEFLKKQDFMKAVRARGASFTKHLLYNLLLPLTQFFTARAVLLLGTVVIIETVLNINGIGWLLWQGMEKRDTPVVLAIALFATVLACFLQMLNEIALKLIDPRLRKDT